ncbi:Crp/Fnr family transcriptional regulator [Inediibacterium massiliense]|uniref:Crp/Fnr family transcriptional regulator n=1 Tax=Inediibacterium massiliense TaxID=1658111 RepID=UPI000A83FFED|nr:Crp/Fnr family transcriptional regulator [Inediibacterium massiliense]
MRSPDIKEILAVPILKELDHKTIDMLIEKGFVQYLEKGRQIFSERDMVNYIYIVLKGKVTIYRYTNRGQKKIIYILEEGELINEVVFDQGSASINCEAFQDAEILYFHRDIFLKIMENNFELTCKIINSMSTKIRRLYRQLKNTVPITIDKKVAAKLWKLGKDYGVEVKEGTLIDLNLTLTYLADMIGSPRESISRSIKRLKDLKIIQYRNRRMIVQLDKLSHYFKEE